MIHRYIFQFFANSKNLDLNSLVSNGKVGLPYGTDTMHFVGGPRTKEELDVAIKKIHRQKKLGLSDVIHALSSDVSRRTKQRVKDACGREDPKEFEIHFGVYPS